MSRTDAELLKLLQEMVGVARNGARGLVFDQRPCKIIDMCAAALLNVLASDASTRLKTRLRGHYPQDPEALEIVAAVGLPRTLGLPLPQVPGFKEFKMRHGGRKRRTLAVPTEKEKVSHDLTEYLTSAYRQVGYQLSDAAGDYLGALIGEVLGNAEEQASGHSGRGTAIASKIAKSVASNCQIALQIDSSRVAPTRSSSTHAYRSASPRR